MFKPFPLHKRDWRQEQGEADGPRQDAADLTSLSSFQVLQFNQPSPHKLLQSTFEIMVPAQ